MSAPMLHGCTGKETFISMKRADDHAKWMRRKYDKPLCAYRCPHCRKYHIGGNDE